MSAQEEGEYLRSAFLKRVAHEIRGPAANVQNAIEEVERSLGEDVLAHRTLLAMARRGITRLVRIAERLEHTATLVDDQSPFKAVPCDLGEIVRRAVATAEALEAKRSIAVTVQAPESPLPWEADTNWLLFAFAELVSNAIRHAKKRVEVTVTTSGDNASLVFANDVANDNTVVQPFEPLRFLPPPEKRGLGLSLAIVRDVIQAHHGKLDIQIEAGSELPTRVGVTLPKKARGGDLEPTLRQ